METKNPETENSELTKIAAIQINTEQLGYNFAKGATNYLMEPLPWILLTIVLFTLARSYFAWGTDDSDADGWNRSGLRVHTDHKTGIEYLSDRNGGLTPRLPKSE